MWSLFFVYLWKPKVNADCLFQSFYSVSFDTESLIEPVAHGFNQAFWFWTISLHFQFEYSNSQDSFLLII